MKLLSATPSPFARKVRIALAEKSISFELITEVPWNKNATAPQYNPLGKIPVLLPPDEDPVYDSRFILDWLEIRYPLPPLLPSEPDDILLTKRLEVLGDGVCDAVALIFIENSREVERRSDDWIARQDAKVRAGIAETARLVDPEKPFLVGDMFGRADIAVGTMLAYVALRYPHANWRKEHPGLATISDRLEARPSFKDTVPVAQTISDRVA